MEIYRFNPFGIYTCLIEGETKGKDISDDNDTSKEKRTNRLVLKVLDSLSKDKHKKKKQTFSYKLKLLNKRQVEVLFSQVSNIRFDFEALGKNSHCKKESNKDKSSDDDEQDDEPKARIIFSKPGKKKIILKVNMTVLETLTSAAESWVKKRNKNILEITQLIFNSKDD